MAPRLKAAAEPAGPPAPRANPVLFGHTEAETAFEAALGAGRLHHAWLLTGAPGIGKATLAFRLARRVLSAAGDPNDPASPMFRRVAGGTHADLLTLEREYDEKRKRLKGEIGVDQARAASGFLHLTAAESGWRVVVVDGAETMNRNAANALLKLLEEPPRRALLLLTSAAPGRLLPTIRSRCRRLDLRPILDMGEALAYLLPQLTEAARAELTVVAAGAPGRAVALSEAGALGLLRLAREAVRSGRLAVPRMHEVADQVVRHEAGFGTFMELLQAELAGSAGRAARAGQGHDAAGRPLAACGEVWQALQRLADETERFSLDKRTAVIAGLELLTES